MDMWPIGHSTGRDASPCLTCIDHLLDRVQKLKCGQWQESGLVQLNRKWWQRGSILETGTCPTESRPSYSHRKIGAGVQDLPPLFLFPEKLRTPVFIP